MRPSVRVVFACVFPFLGSVAVPFEPAGSRALAAQSFPSDDPVIRAIWEEGVGRSQVYELG